jgi:hypothetical protein
MGVAMDPKRIKATLNQIKKSYGKILDSSCQNVIAQAVAMIDQTKTQYDLARKNRTRRLTPEPWGYTIYDTMPLRFKKSKIPNSVELQVDVYCDIRWDEGDMPVRQDIKVRVWCQNDKTIFDESRDAPGMLDLIKENKRQGHPGRVVSRFHLDKANQDQTRGPRYHLQFGGNPQDYELCWHPKKVSVPRLEYQPMELCLTCQMVAMNFFGEEYLEIREKREVREEILVYQDILLKGYYQKCLDVIGNKELLLEELWVG